MTKRLIVVVALTITTITTIATIAVRPVAAGTCEAVSFPDAPSFNVGQHATRARAADFNGDGAVDLIVGNGGNSVTHGRAPGLWIFLNDGHGNFTSGPVLSGTLYVASLAVADFDGDGAPDVMVEEEDTADVIVFLNRRTTFIQMSHFAVGNFFLGFGVGDFNGDGKADVLVRGRLKPIVMLIGRGDGTFIQRDFSVPEGEVASLVMADLNRDGRTDIVYGITLRSEIFVRHADASGAFTGVPRTISTSLRDGWILLGDFDGDRSLDVLLSGSGTKQFIRNIDGSARVTPQVELVDTPTGAGDFTGDGVDDLLMSDLSIVKFDGNEFHRVTPGYYTPGYANLPRVVGAADFNGDGRLDVATMTDKTVSLLLNNGGGHFDAPPRTGYSYVVAVEDVNGDGIEDLVNSRGPVVAFGLPDGTFRSGAFEYVVTTTSSWYGRGADLNADGKTDVVMFRATNLGRSPYQITVLLRRPDGVFAVLSSVEVGYRPQKLDLADLDNDGRPDIIFANGDAPALTIAWGNGDGTFVIEDLAIPLRGGDVLALGDLNGDGRRDIISGGIYDGRFVCMNRGGRHFDIRTDKPTSPWDPGLLADLNGDGKADSVHASYSPGAAFVDVGLGKGDGSFAPPFRTALDLQSAGNPQVADFNLDGMMDLVVVGAGLDGNNKFVVLLGDGKGRFKTSVFGFAESAVRVLDFNGDGRPDLAHSDVIRLNRCADHPTGRRRSAAP